MSSRDDNNVLDDINVSSIKTAIMYLIGGDGVGIFFLQEFVFAAKSFV